MPNLPRCVLLACAAFSLPLRGPAAVPAANPGTPFAFAALGCMPYSRTGDAGAFERLIGEINRHAPAFTVHLGDILGSDETCNDAVFLERRRQFNTFAGALVYTPGDNEWTDSHKAAAGGFRPVERLAKLRELFFPAEQSLGRQPIPLVTQRRDARFARFVENARWVHGTVVFATVHVVGSSNNHSPAVPGALEEWRERDEASAAWVAETFREATQRAAPGVVLFFQANPFIETKGRRGYEVGFEKFLKAVEAAARDFAKPVLLVHADEHRYRLEPAMRFHADGERLPNVTRLETFGAANVHAVIVTVDPASTDVFLAGPLLAPGNALPALPRAKSAK